MSNIPVQFPSVVTCPDLDDPDNESVNYDDVEVGSTAEYSCNEEFELIGEDSRVCQMNGTWSGEAPTCQRREWMCVCCAKHV